MHGLRPFLLRAALVLAIETNLVSAKSIDVWVMGRAATVTVV